MNLMIGEGRRSLSFEAIKKKFLSDFEQKYIEWARIDDWHIREFDKVTEGKLKDLRERLAR